LLARSDICSASARVATALAFQYSKLEMWDVGMALSPIAIHQLGE
jgi:hypothetical protein